MSNYAQLYEQVMGFMQQSLTLSDPFPGTAGDATAKRELIDKLCLRAANSARKKAELLNDWVYNQASAAVTVPAGEVVVLEDLVDVETEEEFSGFKNITEITVDCGDGIEAPVFAQSKLLGLRRKFLKKQYNRSRIELFRGNRLRVTPAASRDYDLIVYGHRWMNMYREADTSVLLVTGELTSNGTTGVIFAPLYRTPDADYAVGGVRYSSVQGNGSVDTYPNGTYYGITDAFVFGVGWKWTLTKFTVTAGVDSVVAAWDSPTYAVPDRGFLPEPLSVETWTAVSPATGEPSLAADLSAITDWLLEHGFEYMQWATICELNHLLEVYLPRSEGKLPPPDRLRDDALEALLRWDSEMVDAHLNCKSR